MIKSDLQLDAKGLSCPLPIVKTKQAMDKIANGQVLEVQATDKGSQADIAAWADSVGHQYLGTINQDDVLIHYLRKGSSEAKVENSFHKTISITEINRTDALVLDVREAAEYAFGHIENAKSIPFGELSGRLDELDKEQKIYVICRSGQRSDLAAQELAKNGFTKVYNVSEGMNSWNGKLIKKF